jgi:hypothetical protein
MCVQFAKSCAQIIGARMGPVPMGRKGMKEMNAEVQAIIMFVRRYMRKPRRRPGDLAFKRARVARREEVTGLEFWVSISKIAGGGSDKGSVVVRWMYVEFDSGAVSTMASVGIKALKMYSI